LAEGASSLRQPVATPTSSVAHASSESLTAFRQARPRRRPRPRGCAGRP
jgi:hypothetical protein